MRDPEDTILTSLVKDMEHSLAGIAQQVFCIIAISEKEQVAPIASVISRGIMKLTEIARGTRDFKGKFKKEVLLMIDVAPLLLDLTNAW